MPDEDDLHRRLRLLEDSLSRALGGVSMLIESNTSGLNNLREDLKSLRTSIEDVKGQVGEIKAQRAIEAVHFEYVKKEATGAHAIARDQALASAKDVAGTERFKASRALQAAIAVAIITGILNLFKDLFLP